MITHAIGAVLSAVGLVVLVAAALDNGFTHVLSVSIFGATMLLTYLMSTLYHAFHGARIKKIFKICDHAAIFLLIAGTYTPFTLLNLSGNIWGDILFGLVWSIAIAGVFFKIFNVTKFRYITVAMYLCMGWIALIAAGPVFTSIPPGGIAFIVAGGLAYSLGVIFYLQDNMRYNHAVWHLFTMAGSALHFVAVLRYAIPANVAVA